MTPFLYFHRLLSSTDPFLFQAVYFIHLCTVVFGVDRGPNVAQRGAVLCQCRLAWVTCRLAWPSETWGFHADLDDERDPFRYQAPSDKVSISNSDTKDFRISNTTPVLIITPLHLLLMELLKTPGCQIRVSAPNKAAGFAQIGV